MRVQSINVLNSKNNDLIRTYMFGYFDGCAQQQQTKVIERRLYVGDIETYKRFVTAFTLHPNGIDASNEWKFLHTKKSQTYNLFAVWASDKNINIIRMQIKLQTKQWFNISFLVCHCSVWSKNSIRHQRIYYWEKFLFVLKSKLQSSPTMLAVNDTQQRMTKYFSDSCQLPTRLSTQIANALTQLSHQLDFSIVNTCCGGAEHLYQLCEPNFVCLFFDFCVSISISKICIGSS